MKTRQELRDRQDRAISERDIAQELAEKCLANGNQRMYTQLVRAAIAWNREVYDLDEQIKAALA